MNFSSLGFLPRVFQYGRDRDAQRPSLHENTVIPKLTCLFRATVLPFRLCQRRATRIWAKVVVKMLKRTGSVITCDFSNSLDKNWTLLHPLHQLLLLADLTPEQGWGRARALWVSNSLTRTAFLTDIPGQDEVYFPETSIYVYNIPKRIRLHTRNNMPIKK